MKPQMILGIALLTIGVALFIVGMNSSDSLADQVSETFTGRFTQETTWYIVGGAALGVAGLSMLMFRGKSAA